MKVQCYSIFDMKAGIFGQPFFSVNHATALRQFTILARDGTSVISKSPGDFALYLLGSFNDEGGELEGLGQATFVINATSVQEQTDHA